MDNSLFQLAWTLNYLKWGFFAITLRELIREHHIVCLKCMSVFFKFCGVHILNSKEGTDFLLDDDRHKQLIISNTQQFYALDLTISGKRLEVPGKKQRKLFFLVSFESIWFDQMDIIKARSFILEYCTFFSKYISLNIKNWILWLNTIWSI